MKHSEECFITYPNTEKCVEKPRRSRVFLTHFEVFGYVMKHSSECFILHLKQMRIFGENWEESWVNLCTFFLTYPNSVSVLISFLFISWIINDFSNPGKVLRLVFELLRNTMTLGKLVIKCPRKPRQDLWKFFSCYRSVWKYIET